MSVPQVPAVWFPTVRTGTGTDVFTERLAAELGRRGVRVAICWLPLRAEYAPWTVMVPEPPPWATVVHVNSWLQSRFLPRHLPVVATVHHSVHLSGWRKGPLRSAYHRYWIAPNERRVMRTAQRVVAVSRFVAEATRSTLCNVPTQIIVNGVDTRRFCPDTKARRCNKPFRLLYVGSWKALKGVDLLAPIMRDLGENFVLHYTRGGTPDHDRDLAPNMYDLGRLSEDSVISAMRDADALLFPSRSEGLPQVAIESLATGLPVIATRGSSLPEVVDDGATGVLCKQDDVRAFAQAARWLAADPIRMAAISQEARASAVARFDIATMVDAYLAVYGSCL